MVQTLTVTDPEKDSDANKANVVKKNPSFARLRRVWETTRAFWDTALDASKAKDNPIIADVCTRLEIVPQNRESLDLGKFHTYELVVNGIRVSVVWDSDNKRFITCDNLAYLAKPEQLGKPPQEIVKPNETFALEEPSGYGARNQVWGSIQVKEAKLLDDEYLPAIPILAEPRTFMALVPGNRALEVVKAIKGKYEREMGKVRNRLPLTLGAVYFGRRTPLAAAMDAGRRMLAVPVNSGQWSVDSDQWSVVSDQWTVNSASKKKPLAKDWQEGMEVTLEKNNRQIALEVSTVMGDGTTPDVWYPYWRVEGKRANWKRWFIGTDGAYWVHVAELQDGDVVEFTPSTFDFEFLDATARRFEVSYDGDGQRRGADKKQRPYLLEEVDEIEETWQRVSELPMSQRKDLEALIEAKRRDWDELRGAESAAFKNFVGSVLRKKEIFSAELERAAVRGMLSDALELHLRIANEKEEQK